MFKVQYSRVDQGQELVSKNRKWIAGKKLYDSVKQNKLVQVQRYLEEVKINIPNNDQKESLSNHITKNN